MTNLVKMQSSLPSLMISAFHLVGRGGSCQQMQGSDVMGAYRPAQGVQADLHI